jgi:four helix bundle protein
VSSKATDKKIMVKNKIKIHNDLIVWQKAMDFVADVYKLIVTMPQSELYGLGSQIRRAVVSIPSNIFESEPRNHDKAFLQFLYVALGSIAELGTQLILAEKLRFISLASLDNLSKIKKLLLDLIKTKNPVRTISNASLLYLPLFTFRYSLFTIHVL